MRKISVLFVFVLFAAVLMMPAETLDEILAKNYETRGGLGKLKAIKTTYIKGKMIQSMMNMEMPIELWHKKPSKMRMEAEFQGKKVVQGYDGKAPVWWIMPFMGSEDPQEMPEDQAKEIIDMAESMDPLIDYKDLGYTLEYEGKEDMEGTEVYKLKLTKKDGKVTTFYLDVETGIELKSATYIKRGENEVLIESIVGDYQEVDGLMMPFSIETKSEGNTMMTMTFELYKFNEDMDDTMFAMPPKKETPPSGENK